MFFWSWGKRLCFIPYGPYSIHGTIIYLPTNWYTIIINKIHVGISFSSSPEFLPSGMENLRLSWKFPKVCVRFFNCQRGADVYLIPKQAPPWFVFRVSFLMDWLYTFHLPCISCGNLVWYNMIANMIYFGCFFPTQHASLCQVKSKETPPCWFLNMWSENPGGPLWLSGFASQHGK